MFDAATDLVSSWIDGSIIPGAALLIGHGEKVLVERYWGVADRKRGVAATADTLWSIASITKPVTAAAMMACVDRGLLDVDTPLQQVVPEFAHPEVTLRHLVTHTSGLAGFSRDNLALRQRHAPIDDFIASFTREEVHFQPGRWHLYSSVGLGLVAECVGRKVRKPGERSMAAYESFTTQLLRDLGATDFAFRPDDAQQERIAWVEDTGQEGLDWEIGNSRYFRSLGFPWGGLYMRARDVLTFIQSFLPGGSTNALSRRSRDAMIKQQVAPPDAPADIAPQQRDVTWDANAPLRSQVPWGLGWQVKGDQPNDFMGAAAHATAFGHYGASGSIAWADPEEELAVVLLTNRAWQSWWPVHEGRAARLADTIMSSLD